jgi:hypothetical protein
LVVRREKKMALLQTMPAIRWWRHKRFWRWVFVCQGLLIAVYVSLFFAGKFSPHYRPDPRIEGKLLSEWTRDIKGFDPLPDEVAHYRAVEVLQSHRGEVTPALIGWLDERDSISEDVYFFTMAWLDAIVPQPPGSSDYWGAHMNHGMAARALRVIGDRDSAVIAALKRSEAYYAGKRYVVSEDIRNALRGLSEPASGAADGGKQPY